MFAACVLLAGCDCAIAHESTDAGDVADVGADAPSDAAAVVCTPNCCVEMDPDVCETACGMVCP